MLHAPTGRRGTGRAVGRLKDVQAERLPGSANTAPTRGRGPRRGARSDRAPENFWGFADRLLDRVAAEDWSWSKTLQALLLMGCLVAALVSAAYELTGLPPWAVAIGVGGVGVDARLSASRYGRRRAASGDATPHADDPTAGPQAGRRLEQRRRRSPPASTSPVPSRAAAQRPAGRPGGPPWAGEIALLLMTPRTWASSCS